MKTWHIRVSMETWHVRVSMETWHIRVSMERWHIRVSMETRHIRVSMETWHIRVSVETWHMWIGKILKTWHVRAPIFCMQNVLTNLSLYALAFLKRGEGSRLSTFPVSISRRNDLELQTWFRIKVRLCNIKTPFVIWKVNTRVSLDYLYKKPQSSLLISCSGANVLLRMLPGA